ncbi:tyrosine-type recombinase/integrase [Methylobacterium sp. J-092]|uniref:tyrosine-type recombinase/integrase n=1 Tax=Methylobacterium sp. J-092 TaxID=2836667 RepID=UPI001FBB8379|nr:site-specific integrase [Methylobacterium sp. J-092]MCJ2009579.1 site-specific integrase [Methylobacterium sp. J-092]
MAGTTGGIKPRAKANKRRKHPRNLYIPQKSRFYHYRFNIEGLGFSGSTETSDPTEARAIKDRAYAAAYLEVQQRKVDRAPNGKIMSMSLRMGMERYMEAQRAKKLSRPENVHRYCAMVMSFIDPATQLSAIDRPFVIDFVLRMRQAQRTVSGQPQPYAESYMKAVKNTLATMLDMAKEDWGVYLPEKPNFSRFKFDCKPRKRYFTAEEIVRIEDKLTPDYARVLYFFLFTGLRLRNGVELLWSQVDWEEKIIKVVVKGGHDREVALTPLVEDILVAQRHLYPPAHPDDAVFKIRALSTQTGPAGQVWQVKGELYPMQGLRFYQTFKAACARAKIPNARPHDLRRTFGTETLRATGDITIVMNRLHHRDIRVTTTAYAFVMSKAVVDGALAAEAHMVAKLGKAKARLGSTGVGTGKIALREPVENPDASKGLTPCQTSKSSGGTIPARTECPSGSDASQASGISLLTRSTQEDNWPAAACEWCFKTLPENTGDEHICTESNACLRTDCEPDSQLDLRLDVASSILGIHDESRSPLDGAEGDLSAASTGFGSLRDAFSQECAAAESHSDPTDADFVELARALKMQRVEAEKLEDRISSLLGQFV